MGTIRHICRAFLALAFAFTGCTITTTNDQCSPDSTVVCQQGAGYSCTGMQTPAQSNSSLTCSSSTMGNAGSMLYCCASPSSGTCAQDPTVANCAAGSTGYSCTGSDTPAQSDMTLSCGSGSAGNAGATLYCCASAGADGGTCAVDPNPSNCAAGSTAFSCSGSASPIESYPMVTCGPGAPAGGGLTVFCCTGAINAVDGGGETGPDAGVESGVDATSDGGVDGAPDTGGDSPADVAASDGGTCSVGVTTGSAACDQCLSSQCCAQVVACDTPDDAGVDDGGNSACEQLLTGSCVSKCIMGDPDAGVPPESLSMCLTDCGVIYSSQAQQAAANLAQCQASSCAQACQ